jgi:Na+/phosphate symporter
MVYYTKLKLLIFNIYLSKLIILPYLGENMPSTIHTGSEAKQALEDFEKKELKGFHPIIRSNLKDAARTLGNIRATRRDILRVMDSLSDIMKTHRHQVLAEVHHYCLRMTGMD